MHTHRQPRDAATAPGNPHTRPAPHTAPPGGHAAGHANHPALAHDQADDLARALLQDAGLRVTKARLAIVRMLASAPEALEAQRIAQDLAHNGLPDADRVTVYRTLTRLVETGIAHRIDPGDRVFRFSLTDHSRCDDHSHRHAHPHLLCDHCGTVRCLGDAEVVVRPLPGASTNTKQTLERLQSDVTLHGTCWDCQAKPALE
ncbi:MAG: hypothetical protein C0475_01690 [Planctomyces sp.]|nr:hypothetical protein [Planctomyces sp.]